LVNFQEREVDESDQFHELEERHGSRKGLSVGDDVCEWYGAGAESRRASHREEVEGVFYGFEIRRYRGTIEQCWDFDVLLPGDLL
jgi:hypothetical protein